MTSNNTAFSMDRLARFLAAEEIMDVPEGYLAVLNDREGEILWHRYALGKSLEKTGKDISKPVTRERVRQLQSVALSKLRRALNQKENNEI